MAKRVVSDVAVREAKAIILRLLQGRTRRGVLEWESVIVRPGVQHFVASGKGVQWLLSWDASGLPELLGTTDLGTIAICGPLAQDLWNEVVALKPAPSADGNEGEIDIINWILRDLKGA